MTTSCTYLMFPESTTWSLRVKAALTASKKMKRVASTHTKMGPTIPQTMPSYKDNQQL